MPVGPGRTARRGPPAAPAHRLRPLLIVVCVLALLAIALPWTLLRHERPEDVAAKYLQALVDGDSAAARRHLDPLDGALEIALSDAVLAATHGGITSFTLDAVELRGTTATVLATVGDEREQHRTVLTLHARAAGPFSPVRWELAPMSLPILTISPLTGTDALIINGQRLEVPAFEYTERGAKQVGISLQVLPGSYAIELPPAQPPLVPRTRVVHVPPVLGRWYSGLIDVDYGLTPPAEAQVRSLVRAEIDQCLRSTSPRPVDCPFAVDLPAGTVGSWSQTRPPEIRYTGMHGDAFRFQGQGMIAEYTVRTPATGQVTDRPRTTARGIVHTMGEHLDVPPSPGTVLVTSTLFAATIAHGPEGYERTGWIYSASRTVLE